MQEISYAEAFERLGGEVELERCADLIALVRAEVANESLEDELRELFPGNASMRRGYSTKLVYQHYVAGLSELYELAVRKSNQISRNPSSTSPEQQEEHHSCQV